MAQLKKIIDKMRRSPDGVRYADLFKVCEEHFGEARQNSKAKAYQVRQVLTGARHIGR